MAEPKFVQRLARLPEVISVITSYPNGVALSALARQFDVDSETLRQDLMTFMEFESVGWDPAINVFSGRVLEFVTGDADELDDRDAFEVEPEDLDDPGSLIVRVLDDSATAPMGIEHLHAGDLALLYSAGLACLDADPEDTHLGSALNVITETMYGEPAEDYSPAEWNRLLPLLQGARAGRQRVDIVYSRAWMPGVDERTVEPLRLVQTKRGWEMDAGPVQPDGSLRTFLLSNIRSAEALGTTFEEPSNLEHRLSVQRRTTTVRMELAQHARWAPDMFAERVTVLSEDEETFQADLELLPPAAERVALLMLASGGDSRLVEATGLLGAATEFIEGLIEHHASPPG